MLKSGLLLFAVLTPNHVLPAHYYEQVPKQ